MRSSYALSTYRVTQTFNLSRKPKDDRKADGFWSLGLVFVEPLNRGMSRYHCFCCIPARQAHYRSELSKEAVCKASREEGSVVNNRSMATVMFHVSRALYSRGIPTRVCQ